MASADVSRSAGSQMVVSIVIRHPFSSAAIALARFAPRAITPASHMSQIETPSRRLRLAERQHQPVRPREHRDRVGEIGDVGIGEAGAAQGSDFGGAGLRRRLSELGGKSAMAR